MPAPALLGKDAAYWQSVHQAGTGLLKERQEAAQKEKDAWQAKVQWPAKGLCAFESFSATAREAHAVMQSLSLQH